VSGKRTATGYVLAVTGLKAEAYIAARSPCIKAIAGGGDAAKLGTLIEEAAIGSDCRGILSFGLAGALGPHLRPGTCVIGREVVHANHRCRTDEAWMTHLRERLPRAAIIGIAGVDRPLVTFEQKLALFAATGAGAVDMESHVAARIAAQRAIPFAVLRVVADPQARDLPPAALAGMRSDGTMDALAVLRALGKDPGQIPQLAHIAADAVRAFWSLLGCYRRVGPSFGLVDLC
jgi:adenosylhomocysteine nucleosidase